MGETFIKKIKSFTEDKRALLLLHGYLCSGEIFKAQKDFFSSYYQVYSPDLKGFGKNKDMQYPYSLTDYAKELKEYMDKNKIVKPDVICHSFGARVLIKTLDLYPDTFGKIIITGGAGLKPKRSLKYFAKKFLYKILKPFFKKERLKKFFSKDYNSLSFVMQQSFIKVVNEDLKKAAGKIENEVLLIYGDRDKETPLYMGKRFHKLIKNSSLSVIKGGGHFCFLECSDKFNFLSREFLLK